MIEGMKKERHRPVVKAGVAQLEREIRELTAVHPLAIEDHPRGMKIQRLMRGSAMMQLTRVAMDQRVQTAFQGRGSTGEEVRGMGRSGQA
jgi:hypothetical protein